MSSAGNNIIIWSIYMYELSRYNTNTRETAEMINECKMLNNLVACKHGDKAEMNERSKKYA